MNHRLLTCSFLTAAAMFAGCGATANYDAPPGFESASLNVTYGGPYQRPVVQAGRVPVDSIPALTEGSQRPGDTGQRGDRASTRQPSRTRQERSETRGSAEHALLIDDSSESHAEPPTSLPDVTERRSTSRDSPPTARAPRDTPIASTGEPGLDYVRTVYALNGVEFQSSDALRVVDLYRAVQQQGTIYHASRPVIGDMVFFHNTEDANRDRRNNDWYTHVGIVESVDDDGTVWFLHFQDGAVTRDRLNLETVSVTNGADAAGNSILRHRKSGDSEYTQYLAGDLFAGFGSVLGDRSEFYVIDDWTPGQQIDTHAALDSHH